MTDTQSPQWVPASLVRIRCFLNRRGMKVKPWLGPDAVLEAFYTALRSQEKHDAFWTELKQLLFDLSSDMNQRVEARGWTIRNELLDAATHGELLTEIRSKLSPETETAPSLKSLAQSLPRRAGALLLMLAGAMVVGCGGETESNSVGGNDGGTNAATGGASSLGGTHGGLGGATATGGQINIHTLVVPERNCPTTGNTSGLDPAEFAACNPKLVAALIPYDIQSDAGKQLLQCLCLFNDAWQTGFAELFSGQSCESIANYFGDCGMNQLCSTDSALMPQEFDADLFVDNCVNVIYVGVRCD